jgi:apoptosis-inducing factor 3
LRLEVVDMADGSWKKVAQSKDIQEGTPFSADLSEEESVLLVRKGNDLFAWGNACPHVGCPLSWGQIHDDEIVCGCHNARFDITTGKLRSAPGVDDLPAYEVREEDGEVFVGKQQPVSFSMPSGSDSRTVVIVGGGAGGNAAAESLRREGFAGRIVMITPEAQRPYDRTLLSKFFLAGDMGFDALAMRPAAFYDDMKIELLTGRRATEVKPAAKGVVLDDGSEVSGDFLILATGATPKRLPVPGADLPGVFVLRSFAEGQKLREAVAGAKKAVVIGASFIGTETAAYMVGRGIDVTVVAPESVPFEQVFGPEVGKRFVKMHSDGGVKLRLGTGVSEITGNGKADGVKLADGTTLPADLVVVGIGVTPVVDYVESSGLATDGAVPVNKHLETPAPGIFAIGDIARVQETDRADATAGGKRVEHWVVAQRQGQEVARSIMGTGKGLAYAPFFWTRQFETSFAYIGFAPEFDETRIDGDVENGKFLIGYFKDGNLAAVGTMGKGTSLIRYGLLLDEGRKISVGDFEKGL